ncbi:MAG TPA: sodium:solute symporter [Planctomycetota bacterium]
MSPLLLAILAYVALQLAVGFWISRRIQSEDDYLVAGRSMGPLLATGTIFATWFGAETCLGGAGAAYDGGVSLGTAEPFAYGLCVVFLGLVFARRLWHLRLTTLADFFERRYSRGVAQLAAVLMIPTSLLWAAAQIRAFGQVLASAGEIELELAITLATALVIVYTAAGGLLADAVTDLLQSACLLLGLGVILVGVVGAGGGWQASLAGAAERVELLPADTGTLALLETWCVPVLGSVVAQELVVRVSAARSAAVARGAALGGGSLYVLVGAVPVFLGLIGPALVPELAHGEGILPELARRFLSPLGFALFAGALVSAILSTVDSTLLVCSSLLSHNLVLPRLRAPTERAKVRLARLGVVGFGLLAFALALTSESVSGLVEQASALGSAGLFVLLVLGLFTRLGGAPSAGAALVAGLVTYVAAEHGGSTTPFLLSLAGAAAAYLAATRWRPR